MFSDTSKLNVPAVSCTIVLVGQFLIALLMLAASSLDTGGVRPLGASGIVSPAWAVVQFDLPASIVEMPPTDCNPAFCQFSQASL
jgi:hypothetical protein